MTQAYTRILGDETVNSALQSKLDREKNWLCKNSFTDYAEKMFQQATLENYGQAEMPEWDDQASKHQCSKGCPFALFEISSRGYISISNKSNLKKLH